VKPCRALVPIYTASFIRSYKEALSAGTDAAAKIFIADLAAATVVLRAPRHRLIDNCTGATITVDGVARLTQAMNPEESRRLPTNLLTSRELDNCHHY